MKFLVYGAIVVVIMGLGGLVVGASGDKLAPEGDKAIENSNIKGGVSAWVISIGPAEPLGNDLYRLPVEVVYPVALEGPEGLAETGMATATGTVQRLFVEVDINKPKRHMSKAIVDAVVAHGKTLGLEVSPHKIVYPAFEIGE